MEQLVELMNKHFKGLVIKKIRYMTNKELKSFGWESSPPVIIFTDGTQLIPSMDEEGNGAAALFVNSKAKDVAKLQVLPTVNKEELL